MADQVLFPSFAYTYVLFLSNGEWYIGSTDDLHRRLKQHREKAGGRTTSMHGFELVYAEACRSLAEARKREKQLKTGYGRAYLNRRLAFERDLQSL
ncbi:MAG: GIY-YIG nuclease family protein [Kiritimatiellae bacterium]|nr:GIY-YIG nuclease family protein [Kiritimatiellia bacterium]